MEFMDAMKLSRENRARRDYPNSKDTRSRFGALFPDFQPKFKLDFNSRLRVFTIGSCFARNIEEELQPFGVVLPTMAFTAPKEEGFERSNSLLNEYNAGTIAQRITTALGGEPAGEETLVPSNDMCSDLLVPGKALVTWERAQERRAEICKVYNGLVECDVVVITLGLVEAWYDSKTKTYLNRMPPVHFARANRGRFELRVLDVSDVMRLLDEAVAALGEAGKKVILTVSPVPLQTTFTFADCLTANEFSKSVLRVCAGALSEKFEHVDYFPSYEIVRSAGLAGLGGDHVHVKGGLVKNVTSFMVRRYSGYPEPLPVAKSNEANQTAFAPKLPKFAGQYQSNRPQGEMAAVAATIEAPPVYSPAEMPRVQRDEAFGHSASPGNTLEYSNESPGLFRRILNFFLRIFS